MIEKLKYYPSKLNLFYWKKSFAQVRLTIDLMRDDRVPRRIKTIPVLVLAYLLSPIDLIPGIPVIGQLDDLAVLLLGMRAFISLTPDHIVAEHQPDLA